MLSSLFSTFFTPYSILHCAQFLLHTSHPLHSVLPDNLYSFHSAHCLEIVYITLYPLSSTANDPVTVLTSPSSSLHSVPTHCTSFCSLSSIHHIVHHDIHSSLASALHNLFPNSMSHSVECFLHTLYPFTRFPFPFSISSLYTGHPLFSTSHCASTILFPIFYSPCPCLVPIILHSIYSLLHTCIFIHHFINPGLQPLYMMLCCYIQHSIPHTRLHTYAPLTMFTLQCPFSSFNSIQPLHFPYSIPTYCFPHTCF